MRPEWLDDSIQQWHMVGSRETCRPAPLFTDTDFLVYDPDCKQFNKLERKGWDSETTVYTTCPDFFSFRYGRTNVLCTESKAFYDKFMEATRLAKKLNLRQKSQRIALFQYILYGNLSGEVPL
jgi:hypothetical protein